MKPLAFDDLLRLPVVGLYETAFRKATGLSLKVVPAECEQKRRVVGHSENGFCKMVGTTPVGCAACQQAEEGVQRSAARKLVSQQISCYAGLTVVAAPVIVGGRHIATLLSGQIFRREPTERDFLMVVKMLGEDQTNEWVMRARTAYFETPVLTAERFQAALRLLEVFAQHLVEVASGQAIARVETDPQAVASAKEFVQTHVEETITLDKVVDHVHLNRFYFCKLFKKVTGLTLTEYVARVRIEKAKALLEDPTRRISEVVFASGFGSVPHFNTVFKHHVGMPPTQYRATLRSCSPA